MSRPPIYATREAALADFAAGKCRRWVIVDGWQVDLCAPVDGPLRDAIEQLAREGTDQEGTETMAETTAIATNTSTPPEIVRPPTPRVEAAIKHLAEALFEDGFPAEVHIVDRRAKYTVSHELRVGVHTVAVVLGPPAPEKPSHMHVVTRRPVGATGPTEIVAVRETAGAAWALVDEIAAERTGSGRHPRWHAEAHAYPVRR